MASGAPTLCNAVVNVGVLRDHSRAAFVEMLAGVRSGVALASPTATPKIGLVLDPALSGPLGLVLEMSLLKAQGVDKIYHLGPNAPGTDHGALVWILRPRVVLARQLADHVGASPPTLRHVVCFVPKRSLLCDRAIEAAVASARISRVCEFGLDLIPFDDDLLSMEAADELRDSRVDGDPTQLYYVARALMRLQAAFGPIPLIRGKGLLAKRLCDILLRLRLEQDAIQQPSQSDAATAASGSTSTAAAAAAAATEEPPCEIGQLVLLDREVDMVTPMLTQLTFEGLIDEIYSIKNGHIDLEAEVVAPPQQQQQQQGAKQPPPAPGKKAIFPLNSNDRVFAELRNLNCAAVGKFLSARARDIDAFYKARHEAKAVTQLRDWMRRLPAMQAEHNALRVHTHIMDMLDKEIKKPEFRAQLDAEQTMLAEDDGEVPYIEECVLRGEPLVRVLRLLVLHSMTRGGFKPKVFDQLKRDIVQTYGYEAMFTLENLERAGLLRHQESRSTFPALRKLLRLLVDNIDETSLEPSDPAYVFSGFSPITARIVEAAARTGGWRSIDEALKLLPGPTFEVEQPGVAQGARPPVTLVFFLGGVTFSEISAIRMLSRIDCAEEVLRDPSHLSPFSYTPPPLPICTTAGSRNDFIIATTKFVNGKTLIKSFVETLPKSPFVGTGKPQQS